MANDKVECKCSFGGIGYCDASGELRTAQLVHSCAEHRDARRKVRAGLRSAFKRLPVALPAPVVVR